MSVFCLIHGSTLSPAGWQFLVAELKRRGHDAFTIDLPVDEPEAGAAHYADIIAAEIRARKGNDVIAIARSASGIFLPLLPERCTVRRLVFLAAFVPQRGMSPLQQFTADPSMMNPPWVGSETLTAHWWTPQI